MTLRADVTDEEVAGLVRGGYDAVAQRYAVYAATIPISHPRHGWLDGLLERLSPASRVLELGCGPGVPAGAAVVVAGHHLVGVDISDRQLQLARQQVASGRFLRADMIDVDFEADSFEAVVALYSFIHVRRCHYGDLFQRIARWLVPGGWFLATFAPGDSPGWLEENLLGLGAANWTNSFDVATTSQLLTDAGLDVEQAEIVRQDEPTGPERWLYVLARPRSPE